MIHVVRWHLGCAKSSRSAEALGFACHTLARVLNGRAAISPDLAVRLEKAGWSSADFWLRRQASYDLAKARSGEDRIPVERHDPEAAELERGWDACPAGVLLESTCEGLLAGFLLLGEPRSRCMPFCFMFPERGVYCLSAGLRQFTMKS